MWPEKNGRTWRIRDIVPGTYPPEKITLAKGFITKTAAKHAMIQMQADALNGQALVPRGGERTVAQLCEEWWEDVGPTYTRVKSRESINGVMNRYIVKLLGPNKLKDVEENPGIVQRWVNDLSAGRTRAWTRVDGTDVPNRGGRKPRPLAPKTVRNAHGLAHQIFQFAISRKLIRANPCADTRLPDEDETEQYYITPADADRLFAGLPEHWRPLVLFLLATGCRWSEALGLRAKNLDVLARKVRILAKTVEDEQGQFHDEDPKSKRGRRTISFTEKVAAALITLAMKDDDRERRIFLGPRGGMIRHKDFYPIWHKATEDAGLKGLRVHDLRHSHVAWLIAAKIPLSAISRRLGHKNIGVTDGIYGHLLEEVHEQIVAALDEAMQVIDFRGIVGESAEDEPRSEPVGNGEIAGWRDVGINDLEP